MSQPLRLEPDWSARTKATKKSIIFPFERDSNPSQVSPVIFEISEWTTSFILLVGEKRGKRVVSGSRTRPPPELEPGLLDVVH